jgi:putative transcriptional regulator
MPGAAKPESARGLPKRADSWLPWPMKPMPTARAEKGQGYLDGKLLIAMPGMRDENFAGTVVYICAHSSEGAMGIVLNRDATDMTFGELLVQLEVIGSEQQIRLPDEVSGTLVLKGGPVETGRGFVLHSPDFFLDNATLPINDGICLTATLDILKAMARDEGPAEALMALGYAGWAPGQLEREIRENGWLFCDADRDLVFSAEPSAKYDRALAKIGIDRLKLSPVAGTA